MFRQRLSIQKSRSYVLIVLLALVIVFMLMLSKCTHPMHKGFSVVNKMEKSGGDTIDVAIEISPLSYRMSGDSIAGLDYEILRHISAMMQRPVKFHPFASLQKASLGLELGYYDIVVSSLPSTESLKRRFRLSEPVYIDFEVLVQNPAKYDIITSQQELAGDTIWIAGGSPFAERIVNLSSEIGEGIYIESVDGHTSEHLVMLVARGEIPRAVVNVGLATRMKKEFYPDLDISVPIGLNRFQCWIVSEKEDGFADKIDSEIVRFKDSDTYRRLLQRY